MRTKAIGCGMMGVAMGMLAACDGAGGASLEQRCESWCERRNMDSDCGPMIDCAASCASIILSAGERCEAEVAAFLACSEDEDDLCSGGSLACNAENTAITMCTADVPTGDAGVPSCNPYGTFTGVRGGISASACGESLSPFTDATVTIAEGPGGSTLLTVSGTGSSSDVTDCEATVSSACALEATCVFETGGSASYTLMIYASFFTGMTSIQTPPPGACTVPWSIEGSR